MGNHPGPPGGWPENTRVTTTAASEPDHRTSCPFSRTLANSPRCRNRVNELFATVRRTSAGAFLVSDLARVRAQPQIALPIPVLSENWNDASGCDLRGLPLSQPAGKQRPTGSLVTGLWEKDPSSPVRSRIRHQWRIQAIGLPHTRVCGKSSAGPRSKPVAGFLLGVRAVAASILREAGELPLHLIQDGAARQFSR